MPDVPDEMRVRQQLVEENRRLAQRCLELESASRRQLEKLRNANAMMGQTDVDLRALLDSAAVGFALVDLSLRIVGTNQALADILKIETDGLIGSNFSNFVYVGKLPAFNRIIAPVNDLDSKREDIIDLLGRDGSLTPCRIVINDWVDENGARRGGFLLVFDSGPELTAARRLLDMEATLGETEKTRSLFLEIVSRELRTPASSVVGMSRMLIDSGLNERQSELAGVIHSSAGSLVKLVDDLVGVIGPESGEEKPNPVPMSPLALARGVVNLFSVRAEDKGLEMRIHVASNVPPRILADPYILRRILVHLLDNSVKFTEKGHVALSVDVVGSNLRFMVSDTGPGVDPTGREFLFRPGHTRDTAVVRRKGGIGVGLTISRRLVSLIGGRLDFESETGRGTEFHFSIPLIRTRASSDTVIEPPAEAIHLPPMSILLADSNPMSTQLIQAYLNFDGHTLTHTENGLDAAEKCRSNRYDLIILDRNLPKLDGLQSLRLIREDERDRTGGGHQRTPVVVMVSQSQIPMSDNIRAAGADGILEKPVKPVELMDAVSRATGVKPVSVARQRHTQTYIARSGGTSIRRIDGSVLANLTQATPDEQFKGMIRFFMEDAVPDLFALKDKIEGPRPDRERIAFAADKIRGFAAYLGFNGIADLLGRITKACRSGKPEYELRELANEISITVDDSLEELRRVLPDAFATISDFAKTD